MPSGAWLYGSLDTVLGHYRRYSSRELRDKLEATGFQVQELFSFNRVPVLGWYVNGRLLNKKHFSRFQLKIFDSLVWLWKRIDRFLPWPGISLIAIAQKPQGQWACGVETQNLASLRENLEVQPAYVTN